MKRILLICIAVLGTTAFAQAEDEDGGMSHSAAELLELGLAAGECAALEAEKPRQLGFWRGAVPNIKGNSPMKSSTNIIDIRKNGHPFGECVETHNRLETE